MHWDMILLRLVHIGTGVYWAGTIIFFATFLEPSVRAAGPEGGKVMLQLFERGYLTIFPVVAALTILSGGWLFWKSSAGFDPNWMGSPLGIGFSAGATSALLGFAVGVLVMRPAAMRIWAIMRAAPTMSEAERGAAMGDVQNLRQRVGTSGRWVAAFLAVAVVAMATARYL
jgi:hypothetical protein